MQNVLPKSTQRYAIAFILIFCSVRAFFYQPPLDMIVQGYIDGINAAGTSSGYVVLEKPEYATKVQYHLRTKNLHILGARQNTTQEAAFVLLDRTRIDPYELQQQLTKDINHKHSMYALYFFDRQKETQDTMLARVPDIVADYREFLDDSKRRNQFGELIYITANPIREYRDVPWKNQKLAMIVEDKRQQKTVYVYKQIPIK